MLGGAGSTDWTFLKPQRQLQARMKALHRDFLEQVIYDTGMQHLHRS